MKIQFLSAIVFGVLSISIASATNVTNVTDSPGIEAQGDQSRLGSGQCNFQPGHGGGDVPSPFQINQHVELAIGEYYALYGTIIAASENSNATSMNSVPMFSVDLQQHQWLASANRIRSPYYYLPGGWSVWGRYLEKRVLMTAQAQAVVVTQPNGSRVFGISLNPVDAGAVTPADPALTVPKPVTK